MKKKNLLRLALLIVLGAAVALVLGNRERFSAQELEAFLAGLGVWGPLGYLLVWLIAPVLFLPGSPITLTGGALFGPLWGTVYTIFGATGGATLAFLVARYLAADWVEKKAHGMLGRLKAGVEAEGWHFVAFARLVPLFPFNLLNYAFGLTRISLRSYVLTSFIFMLPGTAGYIYLGYAGREVLVGGGNLAVILPIALAVFA
ncbi:MAG: TVP38/TMEM64 family protein, partial [bacterium]